MVLLLFWGWGGFVVVLGVGWFCCCFGAGVVLLLFWGWVGLLLLLWGWSGGEGLHMKQACRVCCFPLAVSPTFCPDSVSRSSPPFTTSLFFHRYLPLTEHRESEASEQFSERVQTNLAKGLGVTATELTLSDVKEFVKSKQQGRPAMASPLAEAQPPSSEQLILALRHIYGSDLSVGNITFCNAKENV